LTFMVFPSITKPLLRYLTLGSLGLQVPIPEVVLQLFLLFIPVRITPGRSPLTSLFFHSLLYSTISRPHRSGIQELFFLFFVGFNVKLTTLFYAAHPLFLYANYFTLQTI
jgi:hypothetical protein